MEVLKLTAQRVVTGEQVDVSVQAEHTQNRRIGGHAYARVATFDPVEGGARQTGTSGHGGGAVIPTEARKAKSLTQSSQVAPKIRENSRVCSPHYVS